MTKIPRTPKFKVGYLVKILDKREDLLKSHRTKWFRNFLNVF